MNILFFGQDETGGIVYNLVTLLIFNGAYHAYIIRVNIVPEGTVHWPYIIHVFMKWT